MAPAIWTSTARRSKASPSAPGTRSLRSREALWTPRRRGRPGAPGRAVGGGPFGPGGVGAGPDPGEPGGARARALRRALEGAVRRGPLRALPPLGGAPRPREAFRRVARAAHPLSPEAAMPEELE